MSSKCRCKVYKIMAMFRRAKAVCTINEDLLTALFQNLTLRKDMQIGLPSPPGSTVEGDLKEGYGKNNYGAMTRDTGRNNFF